MQEELEEDDVGLEEDGTGKTKRGRKRGGSRGRERRK